jgi:ribosome-associated protein
MLMADGIDLGRGVRIRDSELQYRFARSGGPGGQNVNKVETQVEVRFDVRTSPSLSDEARARILAAYPRRIDSEGVIRVVARESRSQWKNREEARSKLVALLQKALMTARPRKPSKPTKASRGRRLLEKKRHSASKAFRRKVGGDD